MQEYVVSFTFKENDPNPKHCYHLLFWYTKLLKTIRKQKMQLTGILVLQPTIPYNTFSTNLKLRNEQNVTA